MFNVLQNHDKLVATQTRRRVRVTHALQDASCDFAQNRIARLVPQFVVDTFETIQVEKEDTDFLGVPRGQRNRLFQTVDAEYAIRQSGEVVVRRLMLQPLRKLMMINGNSG